MIAEHTSFKWLLLLLTYNEHVKLHGTGENSPDELHLPVNNATMCTAAVVRVKLKKANLQLVTIEAES